MSLLIASLQQIVMQRPGPPPQRPSAMNSFNSFNFNRTTSGSTPSTGYSYLPRPSPSATASSSNPFSRGFAFGTSSLPPHLAGFPVAPGSGSAAGAGQQGGQSSLSINDFPALGGTGNLNSSSSVNGSMNYASSTSGMPRPGDGLSNDDFPSLNEGFNGNGSSATRDQEQASAAATLQHQRIAREQNQSQTLNAARGGFGEPERNYATKVGMQQPPGMSIAQNWPSTGGAGLGGFESGVTGLNLNGGSGSEAAILGNADGSSSNGGMDGSMLMHNATPAKTPAQQVLTSPADRFGLLGLLNIIKLHDPDLSMLAMGSDLQALGMRLDASDIALSSTFVTPWSDNVAAASLQIEPDFHLPACYNVQPPPPPQSKVATFSDETLFFIFYSTPRDVLQEVAAQELYNRNWRFYRGGLNLWLTKEENVQPTHKDLRAEKGVYIFWDPASWSKVSREFVLAYDALEERTVGVNQASMTGNGQPQQQQQQQQGLTGSAPLSQQQPSSQLAQIGA